MRNANGQFGKKTLESNTIDLMSKAGRDYLASKLAEFEELFQVFNDTEGMVAERLADFAAEEGVVYKGEEYRKAISAQDSRVMHLVAFEKFNQDLRQAARKACQLQDMLKEVA